MVFERARGGPRVLVGILRASATGQPIRTSRGVSYVALSPFLDHAQPWSGPPGGRPVAPGCAAAHLRGRWWHLLAVKGAREKRF